MGVLCACEGCRALPGHLWWVWGKCAAVLRRDVVEVGCLKVCRKGGCAPFGKYVGGCSAQPDAVWLKCCLLCATAHFMCVCSILDSFGGRCYVLRFLKNQMQQALDEGTLLCLTTDNFVSEVWWVMIQVL